jgi:hypothetical protein
VSSVIIHDDADVEVRQYADLDLLEDVQKHGDPMPLVTFADDEAGGDIKALQTVRWFERLRMCCCRPQTRPSGGSSCARSRSCLQ